MNSKALLCSWSISYCLQLYISTLPVCGGKVASSSRCWWHPQHFLNSDWKLLGVQGKQKTNGLSTYNKTSYAILRNLLLIKGILLQRRAIIHVIVNDLFDLPAGGLHIQTVGQRRLVSDNNPYLPSIYLFTEGSISPFKWQQIFSASGPGRAFILTGHSSTILLQNFSPGLYQYKCNI